MNKHSSFSSFGAISISPMNFCPHSCQNVMSLFSSSLYIRDVNWSLFWSKINKIYPFVIYLFALYLGVFDKQILYSKINLCHFFRKIFTLSVEGEHIPWFTCLLSTPYSLFWNISKEVYFLNSKQIILTFLMVRNTRKDKSSLWQLETDLTPSARPWCSSVEHKHRTISDKAIW